MEIRQSEIPLFNYMPEQDLPIVTNISQGIQEFEEKFIPPLREILEEINPIAKQPQTKKDTTLKKSLDILFPEQQYKDKDLQKAKETLGESAPTTEAALKDILTEVQFLASAWLDDFERELFDGLTLQELLHEKGGQ